MAFQIWQQSEKTFLESDFGLIPMDSYVVKLMFIALYYDKYRFPQRTFNQFSFKTRLKNECCIRRRQLHSLSRFLSHNSLLNTFSIQFISSSFKAFYIILSHIIIFNLKATLCYLQCSLTHLCSRDISHTYCVILHISHKN